MTVLGIDGCRAGWIGVLLLDGHARTLTASTLRDLVDGAMDCDRHLQVVGIDMPIGLPDAGSRAADVEARRRLPRGRKSSVFPTPVRAAVEATTWAEANAANRLATGRGFAHQTYNLTPKIAEVDLVARRSAQCVVEVHPEVSFAAMDPACVVPSKKTAAGRAAREEALRGAGVEPPAYRQGRGYARDDLLDACAVAWSARRVAEGSAECLPDPPERFVDGLPAAIWV
jgi:predicted RNase H-like nuclease